MLTGFQRRRPAHIVLAEDDRATARLIEIALQRTGFPHNLTVVHDGDEAIAVLDAASHVSSPNLPDLLLLDLHMPGKNGFEVLQFVKGSGRLRRIPVLMFSSSSLPADVNRAYDLYANAYVNKVTDLSELSRILDSVLHFWLQTATPPVETRSDVRSGQSHSWKPCRTDD